MQTFNLINFCGTELPLAVWREVPWKPEELHRHDCYEMIFVCDGTGSHTLNNHLMPMARGDLFLCTPADCHGYTYEKQPAFYNILFSTSLFDRKELDFFMPLLSRPGKFSFSPANTEKLLKILHEISSELSSEEPGSTLNARACFIHFLVTLFRMRLPETKSDKQTPLTHEEAILNCLLTSFRSHLTLEAMARKIGMSSEYIRRMIKRLTGTTLTDNIRNYRLEEARLKLESTDMSVSELADWLGYYDISHFSKQFQAFYHCSPTKYREAFKKSDTRQLLAQLKKRREVLATKTHSICSEGVNQPGRNRPRRGQRAEGASSLRA